MGGNIRDLKETPVPHQKGSQAKKAKIYIVRVAKLSRFLLFFIYSGLLQPGLFVQLFPGLSSLLVNLCLVSKFPSP